MHGFLNIDKPAGMTSHDVVARIRRIAQQRRVGHAGTLDPAATGVLVVALGGATRLIEYVQEETPKCYRAVIRLGVTTETDDAEGAITATAPIPPLDHAQLEAVLAPFRGTISQVPPTYSAVHHAGRRLYELAREGTVVEVPARTVVIERLVLIDWTAPLLTIEVQCSKGTYIRALARDLGAALQCGAYLHALRRTAVGPFRVEAATPLEALGAATAGHSRVSLSDILLPPDIAVAAWPAATLSPDDVRRVRNGQALVLPELAGDRVRAYTPDGAFLALLVRHGSAWHPDKVFDWS